MWFSRLIGKNRTSTPRYIWVTRPTEDANNIASIVEQAGFTPILAPAITINMLENAAQILQEILTTITPQTYLITSANGARALASSTSARNQPVLAVGTASADCAHALGFTNITNSAGSNPPNSNTMARYIIDHLTPADGTLLHISGQDIAGTLSTTLTQHGFEYHQAELYHATACETLADTVRTAITHHQLAGILCYSARTAQHCCQLLHTAKLQELTATISTISLSHQAAQPLQSLVWRQQLIMAGPTHQDLLASLQKLEYNAPK